MPSEKEVVLNSLTALSKVRPEKPSLACGTTRSQRFPGWLVDNVKWTHLYFNTTIGRIRDLRCTSLEGVFDLLHLSNPPKVLKLPFLVDSSVRFSDDDRGPTFELIYFALGIDGYLERSAQRTRY